MKEIKVSELKAGDIVYNQIYLHAGWTCIGKYYRKEVVKRVTPKRTKIVTDHGEYKAYYTFYEYSEEMEEINKITSAKKKIHNSSYDIQCLIDREKSYLKLDAEKVIKVSELLEEAIEILKGEEKQ